MLFNLPMPHQYLWKESSVLKFNPASLTGKKKKCYEIKSGKYQHLDDNILHKYRISSPRSLQHFAKVMKDTFWREW